MSVSWEVGFRKKPKLKDLDEFMQSQGFSIEDLEGRDFTRTYIFNDAKVSPRAIDFFYEDKVNGQKLFRNLNGGKKVRACGDLTTYSILPLFLKTKIRAHESLKNYLKTYGGPPIVLDEKERLRIIREKNIRRQHDYYKYLDRERLKFYETALAIRDNFNAIVVSEQSGDEIDPDKFPFMSNPFKK